MQLLKVSNSGFYYWLNCPVSRRSIEQAELLDQINKIHTQSKRRYGSPRITAELNTEGFVASRPRVAGLMRRANIKSIVGKKHRVQTTDSKHAYSVVQNVLNRDFHAEDIGQKWVSDLTYIRTAQGWLYLTIVMDLADRKIVGWALSETMEASKTTIPAWRMAVKNRAVKGSLIFHSDRGVQYACNEFRKCLDDFYVD